MKASTEDINNKVVSYRPTLHSNSVLLDFLAEVWISYVCMAYLFHIDFDPFEIPYWNQTGYQNSLFIQKYKTYLVAFYKRALKIERHCATILYATVWKLWKRKPINILKENHGLQNLKFFYGLKLILISQYVKSWCRLKGRLFH